MRDARETERLGAYLGDLIAHRHYIWQVSISELRARHMNTVLGNLWHLLNPILQITVYFLVFGVMLGTDRGVDNFLAYLTVGVFAYGFTQRATMAGSRSLYKHRGLIKLISFPRALLPITSTLTEALAALNVLVVMIAVALLTGEDPAIQWLLIVPIYLTQCVFTSGLAFIAARATNHVADVSQILPFIFRLGFYASGVLFNVNAYIDDNGYRLLFELNPMYCFIELYRDAMLGFTFHWGVLISALCWTIGAFLFGFWWFRAGEEDYGRD